MDPADAGAGYADHLTDSDLGLLARLAQPALASHDAAAALRRRPHEIPALLDDPRVHRAVCGPGDTMTGPAALVSPFLIFAVAVHAAAAELGSAGHLPERLGRQRVPLFDVPQLLDFLTSAQRRLFLAELLASFTRNRDGRYYPPGADPSLAAAGPQHRPAPPQRSAPPDHRTPPSGALRQRGAARRPRRFSELDLPRMAGQLSDIPEADRPGAYRRLGDVALFLAGVFPDYATAHTLGRLATPRLLRAAGIEPARQAELTSGPAIEMLEFLGARWYRAAWATAPAQTARLAVAVEVADRFRQARRVLNHIADRRLFPAGGQWFTPPPASA